MSRPGSLPEPRRATQEDGPFIAEMALLFKCDAASRAVADWMLHTDAGLIQEDSDGRPIGAAWYRRDHSVRNAPPSPISVREVFLGVKPEHQGKKVGKRLLGALIGLAKAERGVDALVGLPVSSGESGQRVLALLKQFGFTDNNGRWSL